MIGRTLGHYRVIQELGRGGMGEVYVADDLNLNRKVALKFLPDAFTNDPERMARFEREARVLASLNHPNIAAIYGLEQADGKRFLVLELVEGETLEERLLNGPLSVEDSLEACRQIAEALEAAHDKGVIHRDLKPANVMIAEGDRVKILDFGLAKALAEETRNVYSSQSPTLTEARTQPGVILGTAAYMSPEQAKGKTVDKRTDIWAFGCILYECLTGRKVADGETFTETLAAVLTREPDFERVPPRVRRLLHLCLEKDPKKRLRDIGDAYAWLEGVQESAPVKRPWLAWSVAAVFILAFAALSFKYVNERKTSPSTGTMRLQIAPPVSLSPEGSFAVSPDGRNLAFAARGPDGIERLWVRELDSLEARPLIGTESNYIPPFFWSPDSRFIAFDAGGKLKKIDIAGGPPQDICDLPGYAIGGSWNKDGVIVLGYPNRGLMRVSAEGKNASAITRPNQELKESLHILPTFLPDGRNFLYYCSSGKPEKNGLYVGSLDRKPEEQGSKQILETNFGAAYVPSRHSGPGQLLFMHEQTLMAQAFDETRLELVDEPRAVAEKVGSFMSFAFFSASANGILIYRSGSAGQINRITWFDRQGKVLGEAGDSGEYWGLSLSPGEERAVASWFNPAQVPSPVDLWLLDFARGTKTRFTFGGSSNQSPIWAPDGSRIIFSSNRKEGVYNLYQKPAGGDKEAGVLLESGEGKDASCWSRDGRFLLYSSQNSKTKADIWVLPLDGDHKPEPFLRTEFNESDAHFSPDMRWVAYTSDESGSSEVYVRRFSPNPGVSPPDSGGKWMISKGGGMGPRWRGDGKELYYRAFDGKVMAVEVAVGVDFKAGTIKPLFQAPVAAPKIFTTYTYFYWEATTDGKRFLIPAPAAESTPSPFTIVLNWLEELKRRMPVK
jgi:eukaryotic-like serine/threonine-protein kinase